MKKINISNRMKNVAKISSGTIVGQIISIITLPLITRIYGAEIIGGWTAISSIATILVYLCDLGISQAIMVEDEKKIEDLYSVVMTISVCICILSSLIVFPYYLLIAKQAIRIAFINCLFVIIYTFTFRQVQTCYIWLNREKEYSTLMRNPVINYSSIAIASITLGLLGFKTYGYYIGITLGQFFTLIHMKRRLPNKALCLDLKKIKTIFYENRDFVKFQMPAQITAQTRQQLPNLLIGTLYGNTTLGYFSISQKLISIPVNFIGQALGKVFYQTLAEMQRKGENIAAFVKRNMNRAMKVAFVPMVLFAAFGDAAIVLFFGREYAIGGTISRIMVFRACFTFISTALTGIDIVLRKQKYSMMTCIAQTIFASLGIVVTYYLTNNIFICTFVIVLSFMVIQMLYFGKMYDLLGIKPIYYYRDIILLLGIVVIFSYIIRYIFVFATNILGITFLEWLKSFMVL